MKYKEIKDKLINKGFKLEYIQSYNELDMLEFINPDIEGEIKITFSNDIEIPQNILDGEEFDYLKSEWIDDLNIGTISFDIDISISFMSDNTLDINGSTKDNIIYLHSEDLNLFDYILDLVCNPYGMFDYIKKYNSEQEIFFDQIKKFLPIIEKYKLPHRISKRSGNDSTLYPSFAIEFYVNNDDSISFNFSTVTFKKDILIAVKPGFLDDDNDGLSIDCDIKDFELVLDMQMNEKNEFEKLYKNYKNN